MNWFAWGNFMGWLAGRSLEGLSMKKKAQAGESFVGWLILIIFILLGIAVVAGLIAKFT